MPFVQAKCPECGGMLAVDSEKKAAVCQFCGGAFVVQDAINNYNTYNTTNNNFNTTHQYADGAVVNIYEDASRDFVIEAGKLKKYTGVSTDVVIPDGVTIIGEKAFFEGIGFTSITIPDSVKVIEDLAFSVCTSLKSITIPDSVTKICDYVFCGCTGLTNITIPDSVTSIGDFVFCGCTGLTNITIPDSVTSIGNRAFAGCKGLTSVTIPDSVTTISDYAFYGCIGLKELKMPASAKIYNSQYTFGGCTNIEKVTLTKGTGKMQNYDLSTSSSDTYYGYTPWCFSRNNIKEIVIDDGVTRIGKRAFEGCTGLTSIKIPDSVTKIDSWAFEGCKGLTSIKIPGSVTNIGYWAFKGCEGLTSIKIPGSVTNIGEGAFKNCTNLRVVDLPKNHNITYGNSVFRGCPDELIQKLPESAKSSGCYVATAVYGSYDCPQVWTLRRYRDNQLAKTWYGRAFIRTYYAISPTLVKWFGHTEWFKNMWQGKLDRMVAKLQADGIESTPYEDKNW